MSITEEATVTSKGQVTIPKHIRETLDIDPGTKVEFTLEDDGTIRVRRKDPAMDRLRAVKEKLEGREIDVEKLRRESKSQWSSHYDEDRT
jgi:antitoxin PrlF